MTLRFRAFFVHLIGSLVVGLSILALVFGLWYPSPLHQALGVTSIFIMLLMVDMVLGPLLTLLVCKPGKQTLKFDLVVIVVLQLTALVYGLGAVFQGRPVWLVFNADRFDVVQAIDIDRRRINEALLQYQVPAWSGPQWVAAVYPDDIERRNEVLFEAAQGGSDIAQRPELYRPLVESAEKMQHRAESLSSLSKYNDPAVVSGALAVWPQATGWLPLMARSQSMVVLLSDGNTKVLAVVPLRPWL
ncbi:TfpX/TfpZ family type IV pilin accessory protein [Pseudomonas sp. SH1-B]